MMVTEAPAVSILMPVRNEERFLGAAIKSISVQTFRDWELVAVDDGSDDVSGAILAEAAARDSRIRLFRSSGKGIVAALNQGLLLCRASVVARMDGDDISHPERLEKQYSCLTSNLDVGLVACSFRHFPRQDLRVGMLFYETWQNSLMSHDAVMADLFVESPFVHPGVMFRKELVIGVGGYRDMGWAEDYDLWLRLAEAGVRFARTEQQLFFWRDRPDRATRTMMQYSLEAFRACKLHHLRRAFLSGVASVILAGAGKEGRAWRRILLEEGIGVSLWIDADPGKAGRTLHGVPVVSPEEVSPGMGLMLITVGTRGARHGIRAWACRKGLREGHDFICVT